MISIPRLTRRRLVAGSAGLAATAAIAPLPRLGWSARAAAQTSPAPAANQTLRWGGTGPIKRLSVAGYGGTPMDRFLALFWLPPFQSDATGKVLPGVCASFDVSPDNLTYTFHV